MRDHQYRFARRLRRLDGRQYRRFLKALWTKRGWDVDDTPTSRSESLDPLRVRDPRGGQQRRILPVRIDTAGEPGTGWPEVNSETDLLVVTGKIDGHSSEAEGLEAQTPPDRPLPEVKLAALPAGVDIDQLRGVTALWQQFRFGIGSSAREELASEFFGCSAAEFTDQAKAHPGAASGEAATDETGDPPQRPGMHAASDSPSTAEELHRSSPGGDPQGSETGNKDLPGSENPEGREEGKIWTRIPVWSRRPTTGAVVLIAALLITASIVTGMGLPVPGGQTGLTGNPDESSERSNPLGEKVTLGRHTTPAGNWAAAKAPGGSPPPGISQNGSIDERKVARSTTTVLNNRSYTLEIVYRERTNGTPQVRWEETIRVGGTSRYLSTVRLLGSPKGTPTVVDPSSSYSDGTRRYERDQRGRVSVKNVSDGRARFSERFGRYIRWYLSVRESTIRERVSERGETYFWLELRGDPWPGVENLTGSALVDDRGLVHEIRRTYTLPGRSNVAVTVTVRLRNVGETRVRPPDWLDTNEQNTTSPTDSGNRTSNGKAIPPHTGTTTPSDDRSDR